MRVELAPLGLPPTNSPSPDPKKKEDIYFIFGTRGIGLLAKGVSLATMHPEIKRDHVQSLVRDPIYVPPPIT